MFVSTETWWNTHGHLWWRKNSDPAELPHLWMVMPDGTFHDYLLPRDDVASLTEEWADGRLGTFNSCELTVEWLDPDESLRVKVDDFGL